jgi:hypothetical protein
VRGGSILLFNRDDLKVLSSAGVKSFAANADLRSSEFGELLDLIVQRLLDVGKLSIRSLNQ